MSGEAQQRFELAMLHSGVGMTIVSPEGRFLEVNPALCEILGRGEAELLAATWQELTHPDDLAVDEGLVTDVIAGRRDSYRLSKRFLKPNGTIVWGDLSVSCVRRASGAVRYFVSQITDVSRDVELRAMLRGVLDSLLDPHLALRAARDDTGKITDFVYIDANPAAFAYLGRNRDEVVGRAMRDLFGDSEATLSLLRWGSAAIESRKPFTMDDAIIVSAVSATSRRFDLRATPFGDDSVSLTWRDVTERYEARMRLADSEQHYRLLANNVTDVVLQARDGILQWLSPSLESALGWNPDEWVGNRFEDFTHPDDVALAQQRRAEINTGATRITRLRLRHRDGTYHWVAIHAAPFTDAQGNRDGIIASFRLIDDQIKAEQLLEFSARHDRLTGLLNREEIYRRLEAMQAHEARSGSRIFIAFADVDNLKASNDTYGHQVGDEVLRVVGERMMQCLREGDLVARIGGDELLLVLNGVGTVDDAVRVMNGVLDAVNRDHTFGEITLRPRMSIGLTDILPGQDVESAVRRADRAMYRGKAAGGNRIELATGDINSD
ncbi:MAG: PAS domain S-box protein [Actinomycetes bacterium]